MGDTRFQPLHRREQRAAGALGKTLGAFAIARDGVALGLGVGKLRGLQPDFQPGKAIPAMAQQRAGGKPDALAGNRKALPCLRDLSAQDLQRQAGTGLREAAMMRVRIGFQPAGQGPGGAVEPLSRDRQQFGGPGQRAGGGAQFIAAALLPALPAHHRAPRETLDLDEQFAAHRNPHFRRCSRRRRALVGGEINQRDIGLMADGRDQRDHALGGGANHNLLVE